MPANIQTLSGPSNLTPKPMNFASHGHTIGLTNTNSAPNPSAPPTSSQTPGSSSEAALSAVPLASTGRQSFRQTGNNVKSNVLSQGDQKFNKGLTFGRASGSSNEQQKKPQWSTAAPTQPSADNNGKAKDPQVPDNRPCDNEHIGDNFMSNVVNGGSQVFDGGLEFYD